MDKMKIRILGGHGGESRGFSTTSYLIDETLLIDAGSVTSALSVAEQAKIEHILISHSHLDHIKDLAFICDNCFGLKKEPFKVWTHQTVKDLIMKHLLNDAIWPDFTQLPSKEKPTMTISPLTPEKKVTLGGYSILPVPVNHPSDASGFIIEKGNSTVLFTLDTGATERIWELAKTLPNLKAIFTEVSFPDALSKVAEISFHHTAKTLKAELSKMPPQVPVILTHFKPNYRDEIVREIKALGEARIQVLEKDGMEFNF